MGLTLSIITLRLPAGECCGEGGRLRDRWLELAMVGGARLFAEPTRFRLRAWAALATVASKLPIPRRWPCQHDGACSLHYMTSQQLLNCQTSSDSIQKGKLLHHWFKNMPFTFLVIQTAHQNKQSFQTKSNTLNTILQSTHTMRMNKGCYTLVSVPLWMHSNYNIYMVFEDIWILLYSCLLERYTMMVGKYMCSRNSWIFFYKITNEIKGAIC